MKTEEEMERNMSEGRQRGGKGRRQKKEIKTKIKN